MPASINMDEISASDVKPGQVWYEVVTQAALRARWELLRVDGPAALMVRVGGDEARTVPLGSLLSDWVLLP